MTCMPGMDREADDVAWSVTRLVSPMCHGPKLVCVSAADRSASLQCPDTCTLRVTTIAMGTPTGWPGSPRLGTMSPACMPGAYQPGMRTNTSFHHASRESCTMQ